MIVDHKNSLKWGCKDEFWLALIKWLYNSLGAWGWGSSGIEKRSLDPICNLTWIFNVASSPTQVSLPVLFEVSELPVKTPISQADCFSHMCVRERECVWRLSALLRSVSFLTKASGLIEKSQANMTSFSGCWVNECFNFIIGASYKCKELKDSVIAFARCSLVLQLSMWS